jgi:hypothetical protein
VLVIAVLGSAAEFATLARPDTAYLLHAAERVLDGARLYVDVVEINPPLIVALNIPAVVIARALEISEILVFRVLLDLVLLGSLAFSAWALRAALGPERDGFRPLVILVAFALFLAPGNDFGQREHLLVALVLPSTLLAVARLQGRAAPAGPAFAAGLIAGLGLALKPHFLLVWVVLEAYAAWRTRAGRPSPEALGTLAVLVLYAAAVVLLVPDFLRMAVLLGPAYNEFGHYSFFTVLWTARGAALCFLAALTCLALYRQARHPVLWLVVLLGLMASYLAGAAQLKAWTYHFFPARTFALILLGLAAIDVRRPFSRPVQRLYGAVAFGVLGTSAIWALAVGLLRVLQRDAARESEQAQLHQLVEAVRRHAPLDGSLYVFSYTINSSFPLVNYSDLTWASRFPHLWIIEAVYHDQLHGTAPLRYHPRAEMEPAERYLNDAVYEDLARHRPDVVMVLRNARDVQANALRRLDYLGYFGRDPRIAAELRHYRFAEEVGQYHLYVRARAPDEPGSLPESQPGAYDVRRSPVTGGRAMLSDTGFLLHLAIFLVLASLAYAAQGRRGHRAEAVDAGQGPP